MWGRLVKSMIRSHIYYDNELQVWSLKGENTEEILAWVTFKSLTVMQAVTDET